MDAFVFPLARQPLFFQCKRTISMNKLSYLVAGLAVWRMIRNQYWSLLILCQISVENHPAWKLKKTQPPKLVHRSPRWQMKVIELRPYFCQKIFFLYRVLFQRWRELKLAENRVLKENIPKNVMNFFLAELNILHNIIHSGLIQNFT